MSNATSGTEIAIFPSFGARTAGASVSPAVPEPVCSSVMILVRIVCRSKANPSEELLSAATSSGITLQAVRGSHFYGRNKLVTSPRQGDDVFVVARPL